MFGASARTEVIFQSTLSMRRATESIVYDTLNTAFQSTLSMRRATDGDVVHARAVPISIHALHEESDPIPFQLHQVVRFQSTLSMRRATSACWIYKPMRRYFNPRSP